MTKKQNLFLFSFFWFKSNITFYFYYPLILSYGRLLNNKKSIVFL